jgi:secreted Zn-dependent insulinase-like peptidase
MQGNYLNNLKNNLDYPPENKFIAREFEIKNLENKEILFPMLIDKNESREIWFKQDNIFHLPKAVVYLQIYLNREILPKSEYSVVSNIINNIIEKELIEISYMAKEASMSVNFFFNLEGLVILIEGFDSALKSSTLEILTKFKETVEKLSLKFKNYNKHLISISSKILFN